MQNLIEKEVTPNAMLDKQSNSNMGKIINDEVNAERKEEYFSLKCRYVGVHVYAVLCKQTLLFIEMYITMNTIC